LLFTKLLHEEKYNVVIDVYSKFSSNLISLCSKAKIRISKYKWYSSFIYTHTYPDAYITKTNAGLALENRLQLLEPIDIVNAPIVKPKIYLSKIERVHSKQYLESNSIDLNKPLFMIAVLGSGPSKTYPFQYMARILDTIIETRPDSQILFNYMPQQKNEARAILDLCAPETKRQVYFNVFGKSLREFLAITYHCQALIGNEGGATNMAKALNIPTFTIFSPWIIKEAWNMFEDNKTHISIHLKDIEPELYEGKKPKRDQKQCLCLI
jgi:heptosyltransferase-2